MPVMKSTDIVSAYKGNNPITKILLGDTLVWPREPLLEFDCVGTGQLLDMTVTNTTGYVGVVVDDTQLQIFSKTSETQYTVLQAQGSGYNKYYPIASSYKINCKLALFKKRVIKIEKRNSDNQRYVADTSIGSIKATLQNPFATNFNVSISLTGRGTQTQSIVQNQSKSVSFTGLSSGTYTLTITDNDTGAVATKALSVGIGNRWSVSKYAIDFGEYTSTSTIPTKIQIYPLTESEARSLAFGDSCVIRMHVKQGRTISGYRVESHAFRTESVLYVGGSGYAASTRIPVYYSSDGYRLFDLVTDETGTVVDVRKPQGFTDSTNSNSGSWYEGSTTAGQFGPKRTWGDSPAELNDSSAGDAGTWRDYNPYYAGHRNNRFFITQGTVIGNYTINHNQSRDDYLLNGTADMYSATPFNTVFAEHTASRFWVPATAAYAEPTAFIDRVTRFSNLCYAKKNNVNYPLKIINGNTSSGNILGGSSGVISENTLASAQGLTGKTTSISIGSVPVQRIKAQSQQELVAIQSDSYGSYDNLRSDRPDTVTISGSKKIQALHSSYVSYNYLRVIGNSARFAFWIKHTDTDTNTRTFEITKVELLAEDQNITFSGGTYTASGYSAGTFTNGINSYLRSVSHELEVDIPPVLDYISYEFYTSSGGSEAVIYNSSIEVNRKAKINMSFPSNSDRPSVSLIDGGSYEFAADGPDYNDLIGDWINDNSFPSSTYINNSLGYKFPMDEESAYFYLFPQASIFPTAIADPPLG